MPSALKLIDDGFDAELHTSRVKREVVDASNDRRLDVVDGEHLFDLRPALFGGDRLVAKRRRRSVPEALAGVLLHRAQGVLAVLAALILIEAAENLADQIAGWAVLELLGDGKEIDAGAVQKSLPCLIWSGIDSSPSAWRVVETRT